MIRELYEFSSRVREKNIKGWQLIFKASKLYLNLFYAITQKNNKKIGVAPQGEIIVSLASFPKRIENTWITIASIMNQTLKPKKIILWLAEDLFPNREDDLPCDLIRLKDRGLEIRFCEDLWPHKKYFFAMSEFQDDIIVTVDDDLFYPENLLEQLWTKHQEYPNAVVCNRGHVVKYTDDGQFDLYNSWDSEKIGLTEPTMQLFPIGCGGVLYPPHLLNEKLFNKDEIRRLCLANDDIWLKTMEVLNHVPAVRGIPGTMIYFDIVGTRKSALLKTNADQGRNDLILKDVCDSYPELRDILYQDWKENHV